MCDALEIEGLRDLNYAQRLAQVEECNAAVAAAVARLDRDAAIARLADAGAPVAPVLTPSEAGRNPQFRTREVFVDDDGDTRTAFPGRLTRAPGPAARSGPGTRLGLIGTAETPTRRQGRVASLDDHDQRVPHAHLLR